MYVIVPNELRDKLYKLIDIEIEKFPKAKLDRDIFYNELLNYYNETGKIPEFKLEPKINRRRDV